MKFKNVSMLGIVLSLLVVSACENIFATLPTEYSLKTYSYASVIKDICPKKEKSCLYGKILNDKVIAFIDGGFLFLVREGDVNVPANRVYLGVGMIKQILPYRNIYMVLTEEGNLDLVDLENNFVTLVEDCTDVEVENNDIVAIKKETFSTLSGTESKYSTVLVFNAYGNTESLTYESFACDGGMFRIDSGTILGITTPTRYQLAKSNMFAVYSELTNNSKAPKALKRIDGVLKVQLTDGEVIPYKTK